MAEPWFSQSSKINKWTNRMGFNVYYIHMKNNFNPAEGWTPSPKGNSAPDYETNVITSKYNNNQWSVVPQVGLMKVEYRQILSLTRKNKEVVSDKPLLKIKHTTLTNSNLYQLNWSALSKILLSISVFEFHTWTIRCACFQILGKKNEQLIVDNLSRKLA